MKTQTFFNSMKSRGILTFLLLLGFAFGNITNVMAQKKVSVKNRTSVLFIDKSTSTEADAFIEQKNKKWLRKAIKENVQTDGDKIIVSFIFENTSNITNKYEFIYHPPRPKTGRMSTNEMRIAKVKFTKRLRAYKKNFATKILTTAFTKESKATATDVVGSIKLLTDISTANSGQVIKVFYFSDMQECSSFKHLSCGHPKSSVTSFDHARTLAQKDVKRIVARYKLSKSCLKNVAGISVIFPSKELDTNHAFSILPEYWNFIFNELGVSHINFY